MPTVQTFLQSVKVRIDDVSDTIIAELATASDPDVPAMSNDQVMTMYGNEILDLITRRVFAIQTNVQYTFPDPVGNPRNMILLSNMPDPVGRMPHYVMQGYNGSGQVLGSMGLQQMMKSWTPYLSRTASQTTYLFNNAGYVGLDQYQTPGMQYSFDCYATAAPMDYEQPNSLIDGLPDYAIDCLEIGTCLKVCQQKIDDPELGPQRLAQMKQDFDEYMLDFAQRLLAIVPDEAYAAFPWAIAVTRATGGRMHAAEGQPA